MYISMVMRSAAIKNIKRLLAIIIPALLVGVIFKNTLLIVIAFLCNFELALIFYFDSKKQVKETVLGVVFILGLSYITLATFFEFIWVQRVGIIIFTFLAFYWINRWKWLNATVFKYAAINWLVLGTLMELLKNKGLLIAATLAVAMSGFFLFSYGLWNEKEIFFLKNIKKRCLKGFSYCTHQILFLLEVRDIEHGKLKKHRRLFSKNYKIFMGSMLKLHEIYTGNEGVIESRRELFLKYHLIVKKLSLLENELICVIKKRKATPFMYRKIRNFMIQFDSLLKHSKEFDQREWEKNYDELYRIFQKYYQKTQQEVLLTLFFAIKALYESQESIEYFFRKEKYEK